MWGLGPILAAHSMIRIRIIAELFARGRCLCPLPLRYCRVGDSGIVLPAGCNFGLPAARQLAYAGQALGLWPEA